MQDYAPCPKNDPMPGPPRLLRARAFRMAPRVRIAPLALIAPVVLALSPILLTHGIGDPSPWLHLRVGEYLRDGGRFGLPDPWAPLAAHAYVPTQWLPSVVVSALTDRFGLGVVVWARVVGIVALAAVVYRSLRGVGAVGVSLATAAVVMVAAWPALTERPQLLGFVLLAAIVALWQASARSGRPHWSLVPLTWLLASTHGVWSLCVAVGAVVVVGTSWTRQGHRQLVTVWAASLVAAALTPLGPRLLLTPFQAGSNGRKFVEEWLPSSARDPHVVAALGLAVVLVALWLHQPDRPSAWEVLLLLMSLGLTLAMQRTVAVAAFVLAPMVTTAWTSRQLPHPQPPHPEPQPPQPPPEPPHRSRVPRSETWGLVAAVLVAALLAVPLAAHAAHDRPAYVPTALEASLDALPEGTRVVAEGDVTGWVLYVAPQLRPVFDLRIESYSPAHVQAYIDARAAERGWQSFVTRTGSTAALLPESAPLAGALQEESGWVERGRDRGFVLLVAR